MHFLKHACVIFNFIMFSECLNIEFETISTVYLPYTYSPTPQYKLDKDAAEQMAYDADSSLIYSVGHTNVHVIDISNPKNPNMLFNKSYDNVDVTDVEVCGGHVFVAFDNLTSREDGFVDVFKGFNRSSGTLDLISHIIVGDLPDMIHPVQDCSKVIVAVEAEPYIDTVNEKLVDKPGGIGIITFADTPYGTYSYKFVDFEKFNTRYTELEKTGVRWIYKEDNNTFSNDIEPEYITFNVDESKAYIALQENNAIAVFDMQTEQIEEILGLGFKNWMNYKVDVSDEDGGINMRYWTVHGMYQPDSIKYFVHHGIGYLIMANEGDSKDYEPYFTEEVRVKDVELSATFEGNDTRRRQMQEKSQLGRLKISTENGKNPETGKFDELYAFGGRSFSIRRADTMELVYDSGNDMEQKTALLSSNIFNSDTEEGEMVKSMMDSRSDDKGPETESLAIGYFGDNTLIAVGNERPGTIALYTLDERFHNIEPTFITLISGIHRTNDTWENLYKNREICMLDPEDMRFIQAEQSPNGKPLLLVSGSVSGTVSIIEVSIKTTTVEDDPSGASGLCSSKVLIMLYVSSLLLR